MTALLHRRTALLLLAGATGLVTIGRAAENGPPLRIGHYSSANGLFGFVLDRLGAQIKFRMDGSDEIWALTAEPASRNNVSLRRDDATYALRIDERGNMTLFTGPISSVKVVRDHDAEPLAIATATRTQAQDHAAVLGRQIKRLSGADVEIALEAPALDENSAGWSVMADAVAIVGISLKEVVADPLGREAVAEKVRRILIRDGGQVAIKLVDQTLVVEIAPDKPISGRPSSRLLTSTIGDLL